MNAARTLPRAMAVLALVGALALSACTGGGSGGDSKVFHFTKNTSLGSLIPVPDRKPAANFSGNLVSGGTTSLAKYKGKPVLLNVFGSWCGPCQTETPQLAELSRQQPKIQFLGDDINDSMGAIKPFLAQSNVRYPVLFDQNIRLPLTLNLPLKGVPATVLIDKSGKVAAVYVGQVTAKDLEKPLATLAKQA